MPPMRQKTFAKNRVRQKQLFTASLPPTKKMPPFTWSSSSCNMPRAWRLFKPGTPQWLEPLTPRFKVCSNGRKRSRRRTSHYPTSTPRRSFMVRFGIVSRNSVQPPTSAHFFCQRLCCKISSSPKLPQHRLAPTVARPKAKSHPSQSASLIPSPLRWRGIFVVCPLPPVLAYPCASHQKKPPIPIRAGAPSPPSASSSRRTPPPANETS